MKPKLVQDRYRLLNLLGQGGEKDVFRAQDQKTGAEVALARVLQADTKQLQDEVATSRLVQSPAVPKVLDYFVDENGTGYIISQLCEGPTLAEQILERPLSTERAFPIFIALAEVVATLHKAGLLHLDIKLENVILSSESPCELHLLDFGIARLSSSDQRAQGHQGTPGYAGPELYRDGVIDERTDVYALGACFFRLLSMEFPLPLKQPISAYTETFLKLRRHDFSVLPPMPAQLKRLLRSMLELERVLRPSMGDVLAALEVLESQTGTRHQAPSLPPQGPLLHPWLRLSSPGVQPEQVLLTKWSFAPLLWLRPQSSTYVEALSADGSLRWSHELPGTYSRGLTADLDGDGVPELYLVGADRLASLDARGMIRFSTRRTPSPAGGPTLFAIPHRRAGRLLIDGDAFDMRGRKRSHDSLFMEGDGERLVNAPSGVGMSYNGFGQQAFRGQDHTPAAIFMEPQAPGFHVAHLESRTRGSSTQLELVIYGPGGRRTGRGEVAISEFHTGDVRAAKRLLASDAPLFNVRDAPLGMVKGTGGVAVVPLLNPPSPFPPQVVALSIPEGKELWRMKLGAKGEGGALLADIDGDGELEVLISTNERALLLDAQTGRIKAEMQAMGTPVGFGDPFGTGFAHLFTVRENAIDIWRGPSTLPGLIGWAGLRADLWQTGTVSAEGVPLGPA